MRIAIGGIAHETNTYADACFGFTTLEHFGVTRGDKIVERNRGVRTFVGGMVDAADALGAEIVPLLAAGCQPSGTIDRSAYDTLKTELLDALRAAMPVDAVALELHGAGVVDGLDDLEADLAEAVRDLVGDAVPIVAPLDLHGNITPRMAAAIDLMLGVHYYPHTDCYERGVEAVQALPALIEGRMTPTTHVEYLPMLMPPSSTNDAPASRINDLCWKFEEDDDVIDATFFHGFPYCDTPLTGAHIVVTTNGDPAKAAAVAKSIARLLWDTRDDFRPETDSPELALRRAQAVAATNPGKPVVINETSDNCGGGAPGDSTHLLRAMLEAKLTEACFGFMFDPDVAQQAHRAGVGATIDVHLGGKHDDLHGEPLVVRAYVKALTDGRFTYTTPMAAGFKVNYGPMCRLVVDGIDVIVGSVRSQTFDTELFLLHGIDVTRYKYVALKSSQHFRAVFEDLAAEIVTSDAPGLTTLRVDAFPRQRASGALWPIDPGADYTG